jgi:hypothetical protein
MKTVYGAGTFDMALSFLAQWGVVGAKTGAPT